MSNEGLTNTEMWRALAWIAVSLTLGQFGRTLMQQGPINWREFAGELCLSLVFSGTLLAFGMLQELEFWQLIFIGGLAGIGGVKTLEWCVQIYKAVRALK